MPAPLLYYITDRITFPGDECTRRQHLLTKIREAVEAGIDYIQLREKDLPTRDLETLTREALQTIQEAKLRTENRELKTKLLINSRTDVALATAADGVHLPANDLSPDEVRRIWNCSAGAPTRVTISLSCHSPEEVPQAAENGGDLALFAPVFEKKDRPNTQRAGLDALHQACQFKIPVLALGGITLDNAAACLRAGAAGIAAIRLFQDHPIAAIVRRLRTL
jgi:thiamine-phosphate pyrophosphorylase